MLESLLKRWFLIGLGIVVLLGYLLPWPSGLPVVSHWNIKAACIICIFLTSGLSLRFRAMVDGLAHWRLHMVVQGTNLVLIPLAALALDQVWAAVGLDAAIRQGFLLVACVPTTIANSLALTRAADGNVAGALTNVTLGNLLGIVLTPWLVLLLIGQMGQVNVPRLLATLGGLVVLPLVIGQLAQPWIKEQLEPWRPWLGSAAQGFLLVLLYVVFSSSFHGAGDAALSGGQVAVTIAIATGLHGLFLAMAWGMAHLPMGFSRGDRVVILICGSEKTLALALPMIAVLFAGDPRLALLTLPILCYHPIQLLIDGVIAPMLKPRDPSQSEDGPGVDDESSSEEDASGDPVAAATTNS